MPAIPATPIIADAGTADKPLQPPQTPREVLTAVRTLLADPSRWAQRAGAEDATGAACKVCDADAVRFCVSGATVRLSPTYHLAESSLDVLGRASRRLYGAGYLTVNDEMEHRDVLRVLDTAIADCGEGEAA
jgi:hypothetical protein